MDRGSGEEAIVTEEWTLSIWFINERGERREMKRETE